MAKTAWGADITYGFECESSDVGIAKVYEPSLTQRGMLVQCSKYGSEYTELLKVWEQEAKTYNKSSNEFGSHLVKKPGAEHWEKLVADPQALQDTIAKFQRSYPNIHPFNDWNLKAATDCTWLRKKLHPEVKRSVWEAIQNPEDPAVEVDQLFDRIETLVRHFHPDARTNLHIHIVFGRPDNQKENYHGLIVTLATLLNDYAALKKYGKPSGSKTLTEQFIGGVGPDYASDLKKSKFQGLEGNHNTYKYNFVGVRDLYDDSNKMGFEIRGGFGKTNALTKSNYRDKLKNITKTITDILMNPCNFRRLRGSASGRPALADPYPLEQHEFFRTRRPDENANDVLTFINEVAEDRVKDTEDKSSFAWGGAAVMTSRWSLAFLPWEEHPSIPDNHKETIKHQRTQLISTLSTIKSKFLAPSAPTVQPPVKLLGGVSPQSNAPPPPAPPPPAAMVLKLQNTPKYVRKFPAATLSEINAAFHKWFSATQVHKHL